jgi:hypothetical protein
VSLAHADTPSPGSAQTSSRHLLSGRKSRALLDARSLGGWVAECSQLLVNVAVWLVGLNRVCSTDNKASESLRLRGFVVFVSRAPCARTD